MSKKTKVNKSPAVGTFISFSQVASASPTSSPVPSVATTNTSYGHETASIGLQPVYTGSDTDLLVISKKLLKKDAVTKIKAFSELIDVLNSRSIVSLGVSPTDNNNHDMEVFCSVVEEFVPFFGYVFVRVVLDNDRKVRELLFKSLLALIHALMPIPTSTKGSIAINATRLLGQESLGAHLQTLMGPWWMATADPCAEVANTAILAFETGPSLFLYLHVFLSSLMTCIQQFHFIQINLYTI